MMAPTIKKRPSARVRFSKPQLPTPSFNAHATSSQLIPSTKSDKRRMKHSTFVSRIEKSRTPTKKKPRRPSKKLVTSLESLIDALPDIPSKVPTTSARTTTSTSAGGEPEPEMGPGKDMRIRQTSLKSRPGALKRKEALDRVERERFAKNLAQMAGGGVMEQGVATGMEHDGGGEGTSRRWAALRGFIQATMDRDLPGEKKS